MKKINILTRDRIIIGVAGVILVVLLVLTVYGTYKEDSKKAQQDELAEEWQELVDAGFYPGRVDGEMSDYAFCFNEYLYHIGAPAVKRYMYTNDDGINYEIRFKYNDMDWKLKTTEFRMDDEYSWSMYSTVEATTGGVTFGIPRGNSGTHICDNSSPFKMDWDAFDVFHVATDENSVITKELRSEVDESNCPFRGLGIMHYEQWEDGEMIWHTDDNGDYSKENGLDLHY